MRNCPVCHQQRQLCDLIRIDNMAIYAHPIDSEVRIDGPLTADVNFLYCSNCGHGFQPESDTALLQRLYLSHYYTPAPFGVGATFAKSFLSFFDDLLRRLTISPNSVLEIACSGGEMLRMIGQRYAPAHLRGYEPNLKTARHAAQNLSLDIVNDFFGTATANQETITYDVILSRHLIEHLTDFADFFTGIDAISYAKSILITETPSLDFAFATHSPDTFHFEHIHAFSAHSLKLLHENFGWHLFDYSTTVDGNLIAVFCRSPHGVLPSLPLFRPLDEAGKHFFRTIDRITKPLILWGAGSSARRILSQTTAQPAWVVDSNPNKAGKVFAGLPYVIAHGPTLLREIIARGEQNSFQLVIASSFVTEIRTELECLGWTSEVITPYPERP